MPWRTFLLATLLSIVSTYVVTPLGEPRAESPARQTAPVLTAAVGIPRSAFTHQQATHWCWAASVSNAFRSAGRSVSQERIVRAIYGNPVNRRSGPASNVAALLNRAWIDDGGEQFRARLVGVFDAEAGRTNFNSRELVVALRAGRPLVIGTSTHAMLLIGVSYREVAGAVHIVEATVFDPWPGVGVRTLQRQEMTPVARHGSLAFIADVVVTP